VTNNGNVDLTNVDLTDSLITLTGPIESLNSNRVMEVGETWTYTGTYTVTLQDIISNGGGDGFIENTATANCSELDPKSDSEAVPLEIITIEEKPACIIYKVVTDVAGKGPTGTVTHDGDVISYQINVINAGNIDLTNVVVTDSLLETLSGPVESLNSNEILEVGETWTYTATYIVTPENMISNGGGDGFIENTATIDCDQLESISDSVKVPIGEAPAEENPAYTIDKIVTDVAGKGPAGKVTASGNVISYQVTVSNIGNVDLTGVFVTDSLLGTLSGPVESLNADGVLEAGETWIYFGTYTVTLEDIISSCEGDGLIKNTAIADCDQLEPISDSAVVSVEGEVPIEVKPGYCLSKSIIGVDEAGDCIINEPGDIIEYRVIVKNEGNVDLTDVSVKDSLITLAGPIGDDIDLGVLNVGETWKFFGNYIVTEEDINGNCEVDGYIENTAVVSCNELPEKVCSVRQPIAQKMDLCIYKSIIGVDEAGDCIINKPGDIIEYQVVVKNEGIIDLTDVLVKDSLITLIGPTGDDIDPGVLNSGELWKFFGNYTVSQEDIRSNGNGDGHIENTATVSCLGLPEKTSSVIQSIILTLSDESNTTRPTTGEDGDSNSGGDESNSGGSSSGSSSGSGSSKSSGGSGSSGCSPEPAKNVEVKEISQAFVSGGHSVKFDFPKNATSVISLSFDAKKTAGKTTTIVEMLKGKSVLVSNLPSNEVYRSFNVWVGNDGYATSKNIENPVVCFKVEKSWIQDKEIDSSSITLNRYNDKEWEQLSTDLTGEDDRYLYFTAKTSGFGSFAITGKEIAKKACNEIQPEHENEDPEQNTGNTKANVEKEPEQEEDASVPGFKAVYGVIGLLAALIGLVIIFLYKRSKQ